MKVAHGSQAPRKSLITDAQAGSSADLASRQFRYLLAMGFRVACFLAMIWVPSPYRWFLLGAAVVLPYIAVLIANQADQRTTSSDFERGGPDPNTPQLGPDATIYLDPPDDSDPARASDDEPSTRDA